MVRGFVIITEGADRVREKIARLKLYGVDEIDMVNGRSTLKEKFLDVARLLKEGMSWWCAR